LTALAEHAQAIAIGPGIPSGDGMRAAVRRLASGAARPMVLDADALNALGTDAPSVLAPAPAARVLTPHPAEMGRLAGAATAEIQADRLGHARRLAAASRAVVVLKGAHTVIAAPDGATFVSPIACPSLATAGSGDVLCGVVGALLAAGVDALTAAQLAVYVHGRAGESLAPGLGDGVVAGDLPLAIASTIADMRSGRGPSKGPRAPAKGSRGGTPRSPTRSSPSSPAREPPRGRATARTRGRNPRRRSPPKPVRRSRR
jgi:NAD(P)H-hydrate epimerase